MKKMILIMALSLFAFMGCGVVGGGLIVDTGYIGGYPPAHARAHGRRAHYRYHYYPNAEFYFDTSRNLYFYLDSGSQWSFSATLPFHLRHHLHNNYVEIEMDDDRPYRKHKYYKNKYRKHKTRYKKNIKSKRKHDNKYKDKHHKNNQKKHRDDDYNKGKKKHYNNGYKKSKKDHSKDGDERSRHKKRKKYDRD
ncbi:MAG: hypothetical protein QM484_04080 [Woeseiaceae bacterium]